MPAVSRWSDKSYLKKFSNEPVEVEVSPFENRAYGERHEMILGDFLDLLSYPLSYRLYLSQSSLLSTVPELRHDVTTSLASSILGIGELYSTAAWIGKHTYTPLHRDPKNLTNLFVQIQGRKQFRIFHPDIEIYNDLKLGTGISNNTSSLDMREDDLGQGMEGVLSSGDGIIIPNGWWHTVRSQDENDDFNISVNWWFALKDKKYPIESH
jgi:Cupin-like domain